MLNSFFGLPTWRRPGYVDPVVSRPTPDHAAELDFLTRRLDAIELAASAMWQLLKTKHGYSDDELVLAIHNVDARDGAVDGRMTPAQAVCPHCHRKALTRQGARCLWCGAEMSIAPL
jgi:hypothetical protein